MTKFRRVPKSFINCVFFYDREKKRKERKIAVEKNSKVNAIGIIFTVFRLPFREKLLEKSNPLGCLFIRAKSKQGEFYTGKVKFVTFVRVLEKFDFFLRNLFLFFFYQRVNFSFAIQDYFTLNVRLDPFRISFFLSFVCIKKKKL